MKEDKSMYSFMLHACAYQNNIFSYSPFVDEESGSEDDGSAALTKKRKRTTLDKPNKKAATEKGMALQ